MNTVRNSIYMLLEGVDLSGKSTIIKSFVASSQEDWAVRHMSLVDKNPLFETARALKKDGSEWIGHLYVEALEYDLEHFVQPTKKTLQDSTLLLRSLAFHSAAKFQNVLRKLEVLALQHPQFDKAYVFTADLETRRERLRRRKNEGGRITSNDLKIFSDTSFFLKMERALTEYAVALFGAHVIDTSNLTVGEVVQQIILP